MRASRPRSQGFSELALIFMILLSFANQSAALTYVFDGGSCQFSVAGGKPPWTIFSATSGMKLQGRRS